MDKEEDMYIRWSEHVSAYGLEHDFLWQNKGCVWAWEVYASMIEDESICMYPKAWYLNDVCDMIHVWEEKINKWRSYWHEGVEMKKYLIWYT